MTQFTKVEQVLKFRDRGPSVEEARKAMFESGDAPTGLTGEVKKNVAAGIPSTPAPVTAPVPKFVRPTKAQLTAINADGSDGESTTLTAGTTAELNNAIALAHHQAQKRGYSIRVDLLDNEGKVLQVAGSTPTRQTPAPALTVVTPPVSTVVQPPVSTVEPPAPTTPTQPEPERIETSKFICEIRQEDGEWIGEIQYKIGGGVERFVGKTRRELDMKLLEGKAHGTLRVREAVRREKYGADLDKIYELPSYLTQEGFNALPKDAQQAVIDTLATQAGMEFKDLHPEYYPSDGNSMKLQKFLDNKNLPFTVKNLEFAFNELMNSEDEELDIRPAARVVPAPAVRVAPTVPTPAATAGDSPVVPAPTVVAPAATVPATPAPVVRRRGSTGLLPGQSSVADTTLDDQGEGKKPTEPVVADLRKLSEIGKPVSKDLKAAYKESLVANKVRRQF